MPKKWGGGGDKEAAALVEPGGPREVSGFRGAGNNSRTTGENRAMNLIRLW
jgi:hypothetical protein